MSKDINSSLSNGQATHILINAGAMSEGVHGDKLKYHSTSDDTSGANYTILSGDGITDNCGASKTVFLYDSSVEEITDAKTEHNATIPDMVNHPPHYTEGYKEVIEMMEDVFGWENLQMYCLINAFKYRMRAGKKNDASEDIKKAEWYEQKAEELNDCDYCEDGTELIPEELPKKGDRFRIVSNSNTHCYRTGDIITILEHVQTDERGVFFSTQDLNGDYVQIGNIKNGNFKLIKSA